MRLADRIREARGLCRDIATDLEVVENLRGAYNPETSAGYLEHISVVTLHELCEHVNELLAHYERQCHKRRKAEERTSR